MNKYFDESFADDYLFTKQFNPIENIKENCLSIAPLIKKEFNGELREAIAGGYHRHFPETTKLYKEYNLLLLVRTSFHELYHRIKECFDHLPIEKEPHYIQCWLNIYNSIYPNANWHAHWHSQFRAWHGFYCVSIPEPSGTFYKIPSLEDELYIPSVEGKIVIGKSDGDLHRSTPNKNHEIPRITVAFDILPCSSSLPFANMLNHWMPI